MKFKEITEARSVDFNYIVKRIIDYKKSNEGENDFNKLFDLLIVDLGIRNNKVKERMSDHLEASIDEVNTMKDYKALATELLNKFGR